MCVFKCVCVNVCLKCCYVFRLRGWVYLCVEISGCVEIEGVGCRNLLTSGG